MSTMASPSINSADLKQVWNLYSDDRKGVCISSAENFGRFMACFGEPLADAAAIFTQTANPDGKVTWTEFEAVMVQPMSDVDPRSELRRAFDSFDTDGDGYLSMKDIVNATASLGDQVSEEDADAVIADATVAGKGTISFEEFCRMMCRS